MVDFRINLDTVASRRGGISLRLVSQSMVDFRITWTLQIGEVRKPRLPVGYNPGRCGF